MTKADRRNSGMAPVFGALALTIFLTAGTSAAEQAANGGFDSGTDGWWATENLVPDAGNGLYCAEVPGGTANPWDAIVGQDGIALIEGESYRFSFTANGDPQGVMRALVQMPVDPYTAYVSVTESLDPDGGRFEAGFASPVSMNDAQIVFQIGGAADPWTFCLDEVSLEGGVEVAAYAPDTGPRVRVNQIGYLPDGPKRATLVSAAKNPLGWEILDTSGAVVASGETRPFGEDVSSALLVHTIDFTGAELASGDYVLAADGEQSYPFRIGADIYDDLRHDALEYYYPARSGIEIDGAIAGEDYARPAGHISEPGGEGPNQGDLGVPCQPADVSEAIYGAPWTCAYTLDVTGGWYDAGDHGKYVVNGGISVAQLLATWERALLRGDTGALEDGTLAIPEAGNDVPDILDEARWELEWMLKMMVPEEGKLAGMVHHKIHDNEWTGIPLMPHLDDKTRELHRPSTAATLNLAAVAAQGARLYDAYDPDFAELLLEKAKIAWQAALDRPEMFAPPEDGNSGGGPYDDDRVSDEFYWAGAELFITTGDPNYLLAIQQSPHWEGEVFRPDGFDWQSVEGFARLQLATVPSGLGGPERERIRQSVIDAANRFVQLQDDEGFGQIYAPASGLYAWGSNHLTLQNAIVVATAYDLTGEEKYRRAALEGVDYIFGRNALNLSYVTGYGDVFAQNQHSRWFANQVNPDLPNPPDGSLAGGANSMIQDPVAQRLLQDCAPQFCYIDDIESWSTNEITINWNAALSWMASWLADVS